MKFAHIADTHIRNLKYQKEYREVFRQLYDSLRKEGVDYIVHCGDIAHTKTQISPEFVELCSEFFRNLASIAPTYIILGNHDGNLKNSNRQDALTPIIEALELPNIHLLKKSGEYDLGNGYCLNVLSIFDEDNWVSPTNKQNVNIALYHGAIAGVQTDSGWVMEHGDHSPEIFQDHDFAFLGDIHKRQIIDGDGRVRYCGSTIQQNHGETLEKGLLLWDIQSKDEFTCKPIIFKNPKPFVTIELTKDGKVPNDDIPVGARIRIVTNNNLPLVKMKRAIDLVKHRYSPETVTFLNRANGTRGNIDQIVEDIKNENLRDISVQERLITEYLKDHEANEDLLKKVYDLNLKYNSEAVDQEEVLRNVNWSLQSVEWDNLFNYGEGNQIDFTKLNGIVGIFGKNYSGKSSIIDSILYTIWNSTSKNERKNLNIINQNRESGSGKASILIEDVEYNISRDSEKYTKKSRSSGDTIEARTNIDFSSHDRVANVGTSLNGLTRNETDKNIRKYFGSLDDFLISSMASQLDALSFIREGSTERKKIFAKFLDLEIFEKKFRLARNDAADLKGAIKRLEARDFQEEIREAQSMLDDSKEQLAEQKLICSSLESDIEVASTGLQAIQQKIDSIPVQVINIQQVLSDIRSYTDERQDLLSSSGADLDEISKKKEVYDKIDEFLAAFDYEELVAKNDKIHKFQEAHTLLEQELANIEKKSSLLEGIPCGNKYPACKFICDANRALLRKEDKQKELASCDSEIESLEPNKVKDHMEKHQVLVGRKSSLYEAMTRLELRVEQTKNAISKVDLALASLYEQRDLYNENKEAIENLESILALKQEKENELSSLKRDLSSCQDEIMSLYKVNGSCEEKLENLVGLQKELDSLREEYSAYDLFMQCMHSNGIAYDVIKKKLPAINEEVAKVLANIVDFEVFFEDDGARLNIFIKHASYDPRPLEMGSGAEKTIAAMAIRLALLSVSSLPKGDIFILDEPGTALDAENMEGFVRILDVVKSYFKTVLLITHLDSLKDCVDMQITIEKKNDCAFVKQ